jgi:magnesium transporter
MVKDKKETFPVDDITKTGEETAPDTPLEVSSEVAYDSPPENILEAMEDLVGLPDDEIFDIRTALDTENADAISALLEDLSVNEKTELLQKVDAQNRIKLLENFGSYFEAEVISFLEDDIRKVVLEEMGAREVARIISDLDSDDALDLILPLDPDFRHDIIRKLSAKTRIALEEGLSFPEDSAGRLMQREFVAVPQFWTVGKTLDYLRAAKDTLPDEFYDIIVIDPGYHVAGEIPLSKLIRASRSEKIETLSLKQTHPIPAIMDQEEVALIFRNEGLASAPVVDEDGRLIGIITHDDVLQVLDEEAEEDILKLGGVEQDDLYRTIMSTATSRSRWLLINLFTAFMAAFVISMFADSIEKIVALAVLMPIVASMGGNAGTQAMTVAVRALATNEVSATNAWRVIGKETAVGLANGMVFSSLIGIVAGLWFEDLQLGMVIASAMVANMIVAGFCGASIPIILDRYRIDPAVASGVFLTTMTDVVGFFSFLGLATIFLL